LSHFLFGWDSICSRFELQHRRVGQLPPLRSARVALDLLQRPVASDRHDFVRRGTALRKARYFANSMVLMGSHYGVPQRRRRLFVIAVRADVAEAVGIRSDSDVLRIFPAPTSTEISFASAVADLHQNDTQLHPFRYAMMVSNFGPLARRLPHEPMRWITPMKAGLGTNRFTAKRCASGLPAPTITASGQQPDGRSGVLHPTEDRKLTIPEMMRVSSLPDDFVFTGTVGQAAERIGMSVLPLMAKAIADTVYQIVLQPYHVAIAAH
jgi:DNA (cytosine-5)-methyltransferase 1